MEFRLELIHGAQVLNSPAGAALPLRSYKGILSALGYADHPLSREQVISLVWPDVPLSVGRNRLRVALVKLRSLMPGAILQSDAGLSLDPKVVWIDAAEVRLAIERSQDSVTTAGELEALSSTLKAVGDGTSFEHEAPGAAEFGEVVARAWLRVSELASELSFFEQSAEAALAATRFDPESVEAWSAYLLSRWRLGPALSAVEEAMHRASKRVQADPKFQETVIQIRSKQAGVRDRISSGRRAFWFDILECIEESRPDLMRAILSAPQTLAASGKQPRIMHDLLQQATPLDLEEKDMTWQRSAARMIGLKAWLGDAQDVLDTAPAVIEACTDVQILRAVWNAVAIGHSLKREWDQAFEALDRTMEYSKQFGSEMYELTTRGNGAFFRMQQGRFAEADAEYGATFERLLEIGTNQAKFEHAIAVGNRALIPVFQGDWETALRNLEAAMDVRTKGGLMVQMGILHASLALARTHLGRLESVVSSMRLAFLDAFESDSFRSQQFTFELAAAAIGVLGDAQFAQALAEWTNEWRGRTQAPRSEAEALLVSRIPSASSFSPLTGEPAAVGKETMKRLRSLVQLAS